MADEQALYTRGESYLRIRLSFRGENEIDKAIAALRASRGAMPIEMALITILDGCSCLSDREWNEAQLRDWEEYRNG